MNEALSLGAAYVAGLTGSAHCLGMCGGLAGAIGMQARTQGASPAQALRSIVGAHVGRLASYALFGAAAGASGAALRALLDIVHLAYALRIVAGVLAIAIAVRIVSRINVFAPIERGGAKLWSRLAPTARSLKSGAVGRSLLLGALWGWLPCGLVYSMALFAAASGRLADGALIMSAFWLGALPAMLSSSLLASQLARAFRAGGVRWAAAAALAGFGVWTMLAAQPGMHAH